MWGEVLTGRWGGPGSGRKLIHVEPSWSFADR
ncbi:hypothetical protein BJ969_004887 [Saccharopolyspora gloriosae]|uniref:Uncharacterized protein n=1 Tax=Saccharopolyspora gloriosae TaxID=455344 RepID=A0A840NRB0_9PSEU|nr:hypothetical protein [Saccharopolyspora gloriosae]